MAARETKPNGKSQLIRDLKNGEFATLYIISGEESYMKEYYLRQLRQQIRQNGYIMSLGQMNVGVAAIAVPVVGADGMAAGAIAVAAPQARFSQEQFLSYVPMLKQASLRISQALGYRQDRLPGQDN